MRSDEAPCLACGSAVPTRARTCPACDYDVDSHDRRRLWLGGLGTGLTLSVVGAPLGLALLWRAHRHHLAAEGTVTGRAAPSTWQHLQSGLVDFCSLERQSGGGTEFRRGGRRAVSEASGLGKG